MHLLACSVFVLLLVQMHVGAQEYENDDKHLYPTRKPALSLKPLCDFNCTKSYRPHIITLSSKYPKCCINVGYCATHRCGKWCRGVCKPVYEQKEQWCGPGDIQKVSVVTKCECKYRKPHPGDKKCKHALVNYYKEIAPKCWYNVRHCRNIPCWKKRTCQPQYRNIRVKCPGGYVWVHKVEKCLCECTDYFYNLEEYMNLVKDKPFHTSETI